MINPIVYHRLMIIVTGVLLLVVHGGRVRVGVLVVVVVGGSGTKLGRERQVEVLSGGLVVLRDRLILPLDLPPEMAHTVTVSMSMVMRVSVPVTVSMSMVMRVVMPVTVSVSMIMRVVLTVSMSLLRTMTIILL